MRKINTILPKSEKWEPTSKTVSPVTQTAEFEVKQAFKKLVGVPLEEEIGRLRRTPPIRIIRAKLRTIKKLGFNLNIFGQKQFYTQKLNGAKIKDCW